MPSTTKKPVNPFKLTPITMLVGGQPQYKGFKIEGEILFDSHFADEVEGNEYELPLTARGENGVLAKNLLVLDAHGRVIGESAEYKKQPLIKNPAGKVVRNGKETDAMYVCKDGTLAPPYDGRDIPNKYVAIQHKATPHADYGVSIVDPTVLFPDGKCRKIRIDLKANQAASPEEIEAKKTQATQKRLETQAARSPEAVNAMLAKKLIEGMAGKPADAILVLLEQMKLPVPEGAEYDHLRAAQA